MTTEARFFQLVSAFGLRKPGADPWDADLLCAQFRGASHGERLAIQFLLNVWDPGKKWSCGKFDVFEALATWDDHNREAFLSWANDPFWP